MNRVLLSAGLLALGLCCGSCGRESDAADSKRVDPQLASHGTIEVTAELIEIPPGAIFKRDLYDYATILKYRVLRVHRGEVDGETIYEARLETESRLAQWLRPAMQYAQFVLLGDLGDKTLQGRDGWFFYRPGLESLTQRIPVDAAADDPVTAILDFRNQLAARGIHLVVVPAPNKESIYPEKVSLRAASLSLAVGTGTRSVLERLQDAGVEVIDLFNLYGRVKSGTAPGPGSDVYLAQDSHWSPVGAELAAQAVANRLLDRGWIQLGDTEYATRIVSTERVGDVLRMLEVPRITDRVGAERVTCRQVIQAATGQPYKDAAASEVLVLGDSFLRIYEQDEPGGAGFVAHLARELRQPVTSIVNDGGASTLVRQELHRRPALLQNKRVVVWEFVERDLRLGIEGWQRVPLPGIPSPSARALPQAAARPLP